MTEFEKYKPIANEILKERLNERGYIFGSEVMDIIHEAYERYQASLKDSNEETQA